MFCSKCGKEINNDAAVCIYCGCATQNMNNNNVNAGPTPIIINNNNSSSSSSSASASASAVNNFGRKKHSLLLDIILICCTGGLWIIWMIVRPKYY